MDVSDAMPEILLNLGLGDLSPTFKENRVGPKEVDGLGSEEFRRLGVVAIGDIVRIKNACRNHLRDGARTILNQRNQLAHQVTSVFGRTESNRTSPAFSTSSLRPNLSRPNMSRLQTRTLMKQKIPKSKTLKVVFIKQTHLPLILTKSMVVCEGFITVKDTDKEIDIFEKLTDASTYPTEKILSYSAKWISVPCLGPGVEWTMDLLKKNVGQGKLYVMVDEKMLDSYTESKLSITDSPDQDLTTNLSEGEMTSSGACSNSETVSSDRHQACSGDLLGSDDDFVEMGTPEVTARRSRLRLNRAVARDKGVSGSVQTVARDQGVSGSVQTVARDQGVSGSVQTVARDQGVSGSVQTVARDQGVSGSVQTVARDQGVSESVGDLSDGSDDSKDYMPEKCMTIGDSDTELQNAIEESLRQKPTFEEALRNWSKSKVSEEDSSPLLIHRQKLMDSLKRSVKRTGFSWLSAVKVSFPGEIGEDYGGPKREFFSLLMKEVAGLVGENGTLQHSVDKLENRLFWFAGRCIVWSVMQGCEGCSFLKKGTFDMVLGREPSLAVEDIPDPEAKAYVLQLQKAETVDQIPSDWLIDIGLSPPFELDKTEQLVHLCLKQILLYRVHAEICQFREGLESFGFLESFKEYPDGLESLLCKTNKITFIQFKEMMQVNFSPEGSNQRKGEEDAVYALELFLLDCFDEDGDVSFEQMLNFWTGSSAVPGMGFHKKLELNFIDGQERLPVAHTCEMSVEIARGVSPDTLKQKMTMAVLWGGEFHLA